jgi:ferredoxin
VQSTCRDCGLECLPICPDIWRRQANGKAISERELNRTIEEEAQLLIQTAACHGAFYSRSLPPSYW